MTPDELEDLAYQGQPMPDLRHMPEVMLFQSFRALYDFAKSHGMTQEQGKREKAQILEAYRVSKFLEEVQEADVRTRKQIEIAAIAYRKNPSIEAADKLLEAIYGDVKRAVP